MFCKKCGAENLDGVTFCKSCGEVLAPGDASAAATGTKPGLSNFASSAVAKAKLKLDAKTIGIIISGVVLLIIVVVVISYLSSGAERAAKSYARDFLAGNYDKAEEHLYIDAQKYYDQELDMSKEDITDGYGDMKDNFDDGVEDAFGKNYRITKIIVDDTDELSSKKAKDMVAGFEARYEDYFVKSSFDKIIQVDLEITAKGSDDEDTDDLVVYVIKSSGKWYILKSPSIYNSDMES